MEIKQQNSFISLCFSVHTTIAELYKYVRVKARELYKDAAENNLEITGPVYWVYTGMNGRSETVFNLDIVIPITKPETYTGRFGIKTVDKIKCLSSIHNGKWERLPETYGQLFSEIGKNNYVPTGICRETYIHMDFINPENNITEVQIGIQ